LRAIATADFGAAPAPHDLPRPAEGELLVRDAAEAAAGRLRVPVHGTYRLDDVPLALADFAAPHAGKLAIAVA
jgi:NADPH:quinone reductase-like Zn-dependent oxidoreductase